MRVILWYLKATVAQSQERAKFRFPVLVNWLSKCDVIPGMSAKLKIYQNLSILNIPNLIVDII